MRYSQGYEPVGGKHSAMLLSVLRYALAFFFVATALLWSDLLHPLLPSSFLVLFLIAVMASAWYGRRIRSVWYAMKSAPTAPFTGKWWMAGAAPL